MTPTSARTCRPFSCWNIASRTAADQPASRISFQSATVRLHRQERQGRNAGIAPHLNLRPGHSRGDRAGFDDKLHEDWLRNDLEKAAIRFATVDLAQSHVAEVKARRLPEIEKVEQEVKRPPQEGNQLLGQPGLRAEGR
jgi:hypothetical protein